MLGSAHVDPVAVQLQTDFLFIAGYQEGLQCCRDGKVDSRIHFLQRPLKLPALTLEQKPNTRQRTPLSQQMAKASRPKVIDLEDEFTRAASGKQGEGKAGTSEGPQPQKRSKVDQYRRQKRARNRDRDKDRER